MREPIVTLAALLLAALVAASCGDDELSGPRVRMVLEPDEGFQVADLDQALDGTLRILDRRADEFGLGSIRVERLADNRFVVEVAGLTPEEAVEKLGRTALLQFCEPVTDEEGNVAVVREGTVQYEPQTCDPLYDPEGNIVVDGGTVEFASWPPSADDLYTTDAIVWQPAKGDLDGEETALTGEFLRPDTFVASDPVLGMPILILNWNGDGAEISEQVTARLSQQMYPIAPFLDGEPILGEDGRIIAPNVQGVVRSQAQITGLSRAEAEELSTLLNSGAFPLPLRVVRVEEITD